MMDDCELITLVGEIDMVRSAELREAAETFRLSSSANVVVDVSEVSFFGSEGIGFLVSLYKAVTERAGTVTLLDPDAAILRLIAICGLDGVIHSRVSVATVGQAQEQDPRTAPAGRSRRVVPEPRG
jgi:anti-sigma B factor antagonist